MTRPTMTDPPPDPIVAYSISWVRVAWPDNNDGVPDVANGWYAAGGWYFDSDDKLAAAPLMLVDGQTIEDVRAEYYMTDNGTGEWSCEGFKESYATGASTSLTLHEYTAEDLANE